MIHVTTIEVVKNMANRIFAQRFDAFLQINDGQKLANNRSILNQGRVDFAVPYIDHVSGITISTTDLVAMYAFYYFQMHYSSMVAVLHQLKMENKSFDCNKTLFIDIGCGPMTAGVSIAAYCSQTTTLPINLNYIGIDRAQAMLDLATEVKNDSSLFDPKSKIEFYSTIDKLDELTVDQHITDLVVIFSFLSSSKFLNVGFFKHIDNFLVRNSHLNLHLIEQNPILISTSPYWNQFIQKYQAWDNLKLDSLHYGFDNDMLLNYGRDKLDFWVKMYYFYKKAEAC